MFNGQSLPSLQSLRHAANLRHYKSHSGAHLFVRVSRSSPTPVWNPLTVMYREQCMIIEFCCDNNLTFCQMPPQSLSNELCQSSNTHSFELILIVNLLTSKGFHLERFGIFSMFWSTMVLEVRNANVDLSNNISCIIFHQQGIPTCQ